MPAVEVRDLWWRYPSYGGAKNPYVLKGVTFDVDKGEFVGITGPSGAGKTTLCYALTGIIPNVFRPPAADPGEYLRGEVKVLGRSPAEPRGRASYRGAGAAGSGDSGKEGEGGKVGLLLQDPENQFLRMDLLHEVAFGMELMGLPPDEIERRAKEAFEVVGLSGLWPIADKVHPSELSGGQKQRAAIASFLAMRPEVLILDEPTSDLDPRGKLEVIDAINAIRKEHDVTIVLVEHNPEVMLAHADRLLVLDGGEVVALGDPREVYGNEELVRRHGLYAPEVARIASSLGVEYAGRLPFTVEEAAHALGGLLDGEASLPLPPGVGETDCEQAPRGKCDAEAAVEVQGVHYWYPDGTYALRGASFCVRRGDFVALIGQNGSGKTTISRLVAGIYSGFKGSIRVFGKDVADKKVARSLPLLVGYVFQNPDHQIFTRRVFDEVAYGLRNLRVDEEEVKRRVEEALVSVGLEDKVDEDPMFLGKGEKRRLAVASVIAMSPPVVVVDEPTTGQDFRMSEDIMKLLRKLNQAGTTILAVTHDMGLVAEHAKSVIGMKEGRVVYEGPTRNFFSDQSLVDEVGVVSPQAVRLSVALRKGKKEFPILITADEWSEAFKKPLASEPRDSREGLLGEPRGNFGAAGSRGLSSAGLD